MTSSAPDRSRHLPSRVGSMLLILMSVTACGPSTDDAGVTERPPVDGAEYRFLDVNGIRMRVVEQGEGPLVLLAHGWPESWYSWRHQLPALAAAGYHAVAPDMRGYGGTDAPSEIEDYDIFDLCGDLVGLIDALGEEQAVLVGHDWGSLVSRDCVRLEADRFSAVVNMSVPFGGWGTSPIENLRNQYGDNFYYILYFQELRRGRARRSRSGVRRRPTRHPEPALPNRCDPASPRGYRPVAVSWRLDPAEGGAHRLSGLDQRR